MDRINPCFACDCLVETGECLADSCTSYLPKTQAVNGELRVGDWALVVPDETYGCLIGQVTAIDKLGTPEHDRAENEMDKVHVNFHAVEHTRVMKADLLEAFDDLYPDAQTFDEMLLDDVVISSGSLISLVGFDLEYIGELAGSYKAAYEAANKVLSMDVANHCE
jgi:hypothetical protein